MMMMIKSLFYLAYQGGCIVLSFVHYLYEEKYNSQTANSG